MDSLDWDSKDIVQAGAYIGDGVVDGSGPRFDVLDPATGKPWISLHSCTAADVDKAVECAQTTFETYKKVPARSRARMLLEWDRLIRENKNDIARIVSLETGKPYNEALGEVDYALTFSWWMAGEAERAHGSTTQGAVPSNRYVVIKQPLGVVGCLTAWNFPVALLVRKVATALAAGCTVVAKPSPETPVSAVALAILAAKAGFPAGAFNVLPCDAERTPQIGSAICQHPSVKKVSFTGSTAVGKLLAAQCASTLKKLTLELGGNGAFIIFDDADLKLALDSLMVCKFRNSGQTCVCAQRVFVHSSIYDAVAKKLEARIKSDLKVGRAFDAGVTVGPLTTARSASKVVHHIEDAVTKGANLVIGGGTPTHTDSNGYFFEPTLLTNVSDAMAISKEETFGPVLPLYRFDTESEVLRRANDTTMGLTSYVFTRNADRIWRMFEGLETGNVGINTGLTTSAEAPFGGWNDSGYGKEAGKEYAINEYLKVKTATWQVQLTTD